MPITARKPGCTITGRMHRSMKFFLSALAIALLMFGIATRATAQSFHGCEGLERSPVPAVEGLGGTFFRIEPDLLMDTRLPTPLIDDLAAISRNLESNGTHLILVPVPTKGLVQGEDLGPDAARLGYDSRLARALYADSIAHLRSQGVTAVDAVSALDELSPKKSPFFRADPRMTDEGLHRLAQAIAEEAGEGYSGTAEFVTTPGSPIDLASPERFRLQLSCLEELPAVQTGGYTTAAAAPIPEHAQITVVGSTITGGDARNFPGFLAQALSRPIAQVITGDSAYEAMTAYLTSNDFRRERPEAIVWLVPIWQNPALHGDQPLREIAAAAADRCGSETDTTKLSDGQYAVALGSHTAADSLRLNTGGTPVANAIFRFTSPDGQIRIRRIIRPNSSNATPVAFMPLSGLWPEGAAQVTVELDTSPASAPTISVCGG